MDEPTGEAMSRFEMQVFINDYAKRGGGGENSC